MTEIFTFESLTMLADPPPESLPESDVRWTLELSRREAQLFAEKNETNPEWLLRAAEFAHDTARYEQSQGFLTEVVASLGADQARIQARALLFQSMNYLAAVDGPNSEHCLRALARLADDSADKTVGAMYSLAKGMNLQYSSVYIKERQIEKGASLAQPFFEDAVGVLAEVGEVDLAVRAQIELARTLFELGWFFSGVDALEQAFTLCRNGESWGQIGRIMLLLGSNASDMGYRIGVREIIQMAVAWCDYLGDAWGRVEGLTVMGRFLYYSMPPNHPELAGEADTYLQSAIEDAEAYGVPRLKATVDSTRFFLYRKAGDDKKLQLLLGDQLEEEEFRKKQALDNRLEIERIEDERRRKTAMRLHDGVEVSLDAMFVFDAFRDSNGRCRDFVWVYMNRAANKICEQCGSQVYLFSEARLLPQLSGLDDAMLQAVNDRQAFEDTVSVQLDGSEQWLQRRVLPSGEGAFVTLRDVTAEKRIESVLREAAESARQSESAKSAFLASMSHEIRTPLNGVLGLTRMLAETELNSIQRGYVENIVLSGNILLDLIGDVLDLSKIEAREMHLTESRVSVAGLVTSVANLFQGQAKERGISLSTDVAASVPDTVLADGTRLRQILSNLVGNAIKFTENGSVQIKVLTAAKGVVFEVTDTGIGISPDQISLIFSRFKQVASSARGGTGLGLAIAKALVELMGGEVRATSELGRGSIFTVTLPLREIPATASQAKYSASARFDGRRVLVVDDNPINLLVSSHAIEKLGCETVCAGDGSEALDILTKERFDVVFLDVQMPVMDGLEATRELRRREADGPRTLVIALTAGALLQEQQACLEAGMDDFITKPITLESIQNVLTKWLTD